jgi:hypothetical protein
LAPAGSTLETLFRIVNPAPMLSPTCETVSTSPFTARVADRPGTQDRAAFAQSRKSPPEPAAIPFGRPCGPSCPWAQKGCARSLPRSQRHKARPLRDAQRCQRFGSPDASCQEGPFPGASRAVECPASNQPRALWSSAVRGQMLYLPLDSRIPPSRMLGGPRVAQRQPEPLTR